MKILLCLPLLLLTTQVWGADLIIGGETRYTVQEGDRLELIGAKLGVFWKNIARENGLGPDVRIVPGQEIKVTTRKIVPRIVEDGIIINIADRTLYFFKKGKLTAVPVGLGLPLETDFGDWRTPMGKFTITGKRRNPVWYVPESIQLEQAAKGKPVEESVPPGPKNPLGRYALTTSIPGVLIHETIRPASVYRYQSHGCIRVLPENMEKLFGEVDKGTKGELIYEPVKIAVDESGRAYLEVRTDTYRKLASVRQDVWKRIEGRGLSAKVNKEQVERIIKEQTGIAEEIAPPPSTVGRRTPRKQLLEKVIDFFSPRPGKTNASHGQGIGRGITVSQNPALISSLSTASV